MNQTHHGGGIDPAILKQVLRQRRMSAAELSRASGVSKATISLIMAGKRHATSATNTAKLAEALGVSVDYLLGLSTTPEPTPLMLGEMLLELTQVARKLTPRRQRDLLAIAQTYLQLAQDAPREPTRLMDDMLDLIEEYDGSLSRDQILDLIVRARAAGGPRGAPSALDDSH